MKRREFLQATAAFAVMPSAVRETIAAQQPAADGWRNYEITTKVEILNPSGVSRVWVPLPYTASTDWHNSRGSQWMGNGQMKKVTDSKYGAEMVYAEWKAGTKDPAVEVTSRFATRDREIDLSRPNPKAPKLSPAEVKFNTAATELIPTDGIVRETAQAIVKGAKTDVEKARAI
jgi:hypothetical protein